MQSIYNYIPQRKHISSVTYSFAGVIYLQIMPHVLLLLLLLLTLYYYLKQAMFLIIDVVWKLFCVYTYGTPNGISNLNIFYFHITTFPNNCAVFRMTAVHMSSMSCFPSMLLRYFLNILEIIPVNTIITRIY